MTKPIMSSAFACLLNEKYRRIAATLAARLPLLVLLVLGSLPAAPAAPWAGNVVVTSVGTVTFTFSDSGSGTMNYSINGVSGSRTITRQAF